MYTYKYVCYACTCLFTLAVSGKQPKELRDLTRLIRALQFGLAKHGQRQL